MQTTPAEAGKHAGLEVQLPGVGRVTLLQAIARNPETALYLTDHTGIVVKVFDLDCGRPDEVSYGPYTNYQAEAATFADIREIEALRPHVPGWFGAECDFDRKLAFIAMEYLSGDNLRHWAADLAEAGYEPGRVDDLFRAILDTFSLVHLFHQHGVIIVDFKPDNVIRQPDGAIKLVDLGAFFMPRHRQDLASFAYTATPDHAEVLIDASNLLAQRPLTVASDVFSAGVALFELATGESRLRIDPATAREMLEEPSMYRFQDSQIRDIWKSFPHLRAELPLIETQLKECRLLFPEFWHLLKAYLAERVPEWESMSEAERGELLRETGRTFIREQLPDPLGWLAEPITRATILRSLRVADMAELIQWIGNPAPAEAIEFIARENRSLAYLRRLDLPTDFVPRLNTWDVRRDPDTGGWVLAAPALARQVADAAPWLHLRRVRPLPDGGECWELVDELEADRQTDGPVSLARLRSNHRAWLV